MGRAFKFKGEKYSCKNEMKNQLEEERMARMVCAKKAPTRLRRVRDSPWAQESSSGYSTSVCRSCCRACSICRRCGASLRSATTSFRAAAQKQILFHVFAREDNGCVCTTECDLQASHRVWQGNARPPRRHVAPLLLSRQRGSGWGTGRRADRATCQISASLAASEPPCTRLAVKKDCENAGILATLCALALIVPSCCAPAEADAPIQNVASSSLGGRAVAAHSQPTFTPDLAIDGKEDEGRGWAYHGRIDEAAIVFAFARPSVISRLRIASGKGMPDHRVVTLRLFYWPVKEAADAGLAAAEEAAALEEFLRHPQNWTYGFGEQWQAVRGLSMPKLEASRVFPGTVSIVGHVVYSLVDRLVSRGHDVLELDVLPVLARAFALRIERSDAPFGNAVINEFEAWGHPLRVGQVSAHLQEAAAAAEAADGNLDFAHFLATSCRRRAEPAELLQEMSAGYWLPLTPQQFPQHFLPGQSSGTFKRESDIEGKMGWGQVRRRRNLNCQAEQVWMSPTPVPAIKANSVCRALGRVEMLFVGDSRTRQLVIGLLVLVEQVLPKLARSQDGGGGARAWATLAEEAESELSFLGPEWKDVAVPSEFAANCSGSKRYLHSDPAVCAGVLTLSHRACEGEVGIHFVESWRRDHIVSVQRAVRQRMLDAAQAGASLYIMDGSGLHFIMSGAGLRAGFDGYLSEMLGTLRRYRLQEQSVAAVLVKILIEPYAVDQIDPVRGDRNVVNNWNIASMNMAAMDALRGSKTDGDDDVAHHKDATGGRAADRDGKDSGFSEGWCKESPQHTGLEPCRHAGQSAGRLPSAPPDEPHATWGTQRSALAEDTFILDTWPLIGSRSSDCSFDGVHYNEGFHLFKAEVILAFLSYAEIQRSGRCDTWLVNASSST